MKGRTDEGQDELEYKLEVAITRLIPNWLGMKLECNMLVSHMRRMLLALPPFRLELLSLAISSPEP